MLFKKPKTKSQQPIAEMPQVAVDIHKISKSYGRPPLFALKDLSLQVKENERLGIVGPNGSGKTTLIRIILGFIRPDKGQITVFGNRNSEKNAGMIGFVSENQQGMENFTPRELLHYAGKLQGMEPPDIAKRCNELLEFTSMQSAADRLIGSFSRGMAQRTHIAAALIHRPKLLLLDEALSGIDPAGQAELTTLLSQLDGITLMLASHQLEEVEALCQKTIIMNSGQIAESLEISTLKKTLHTLMIDPVAETVLRKIGVQEIDRQVEAKWLTVRFAATTEEFLAIVQQFRDQNITIHQMRSRSYLEEVYHQYSSQTEGAETLSQDA